MKTSKSTVVIIDYGMGNLFSVKLACKKAGIEALISSKKSDIAQAAALILPGVGAFGDAMQNLQKLNLVEPIKEFVKSGKPLLGICLGMQLLMSESEEFGVHQGLGIIQGRVVRFPTDKDKVPQVGWNQIMVPVNGKAWSKNLLGGLKEKEYQYFVHSFYCIPDKKEVVVSVTHYAGIDYCSSLQQENVFACQFHPEKSGEKGLLIYKNLAKAI